MIAQIKINCNSPLQYSKLVATAIEFSDQGNIVCMIHNNYMYASEHKKIGGPGN